MKCMKMRSKKWLSLKSLQKYCEIITDNDVKLYALCGKKSGYIVGRHLLSHVEHTWSICSTEMVNKLNQSSSLTLISQFQLSN